MMTAAEMKSYRDIGTVNSRELAAIARTATYCQQRLEALAAKLAEFEGRPEPLSRDFEDLRRRVLVLRGQFAFLAGSARDDREEVQRRLAK